MREMRPPDAVDLGGGHWFQWITGDPERYPTDDSRFRDWPGSDGRNLVGIIEGHLRPDGRQCEGFVSFVRGLSEPERPTWTVLSLEPLRIDPSVHCVKEKGGCGSHGWIHDGRWTDA